MIRKLKRMTEKTKNIIKKILEQKYDWTIDDRDFNVFFMRNQRFFKAKSKQRNEINDMNKRKTRNETNAKNECDENNCFNM